MDYKSCVLFFLNIYAQIVYYIRSFVFQYIYTKPTHIFFKISNVYHITFKTNMTENFLTNKLDFFDNDIVCFEWIFDNVKYIQYIKKDTFQYLIPYSIFSMRNIQTEHKIIACMLTNNNTNEIENITSTIRQIAGPKQNFFKDFYKVHTKDIFGIQNKTIDLITTHKSYQFDLSKDNILEL